MDPESQSQIKAVADRYGAEQMVVVLGAADARPRTQAGAVGPGRMLETLLAGKGAVSSTLICGDSFFNEHGEEAEQAVSEWLHASTPDLVFAGPAFAAGRYGVACSHVCRL